VSLARYAWLARHVNSRPSFGLRHELCAAGRRYDVMVFLKSMGARNLDRLASARRRGARVVFDVNVNYYESAGAEYYEGMLPTRQQQVDAIEMSRAADAIIADSSFLESVCRKHNERVRWIPDNVDLDRVPEYRPWRIGGGPLRILWSGESIKLFEFLAIENVLRKYASKIELVLVTNSLSSLDRWQSQYRERFNSLLRDVPHRTIPYRSITDLFDVYSQGGVLVSPRFLDNSYNLGHTEWKITLGMACGRMALCSPVPSYLDVAVRSGGSGIRICRTAEDWEQALEALLSGEADLDREEMSARRVVETHYSTPVVARSHSAFVREVFLGEGSAVEAASRPGAEGTFAAPMGGHA
jgi:glycosyltransferase involved in cell wall biosynthesis